MSDMSAVKQRLNDQTSAEILAEVSALAHSEGRELQALIDEALKDLLEKRNNRRPRAHVMDAYNAGHASYAELYQKLAQ